MSEQQTSTAREPGFYWVRLRDNASWEPAEWNGEKWFVAGDWKGYEESRFSTIGARLLPPEAAYA
jgi:hypothetical protein